MKTLRLSMILLTALSLLSIHSVAAQEAAKLDPIIVAYLETSTVAIAHVDLSKVDVPTVVDWANKLSGEAPEQTMTVKLFGTALVRSLVDAGVTHAYATASLLGIAQGGAALILPCREPAAVKTLVETFVAQAPKELSYKVFAIDGLVVVTTRAIWARIESKPDAGRESLLAAIQPGIAHAAAVAINLPQALQQEVAQVWPDRLPDEAPVQLSPKQLMNDWQAICFTVDLPPAASVSAVISCESPESARRTHDLVERLRTKLSPPVSEAKVTSQGRTLRVTIEDSQLVGAIEQIRAPMRAAAGEAQSMNNLKQIIIAMHDYYSAYNFLPPRETRSRTDQPLLSWRVHILPYLGQQALYKKFDLSQAWNSPHNAKLIDAMPSVYKVDGDTLATGRTRYVLPLLEGGAWFGDGPPLTFNQMKDGTSNTIAVVIGPPEAAVTWTKPAELNLSADRIIEQLFGKAETLPVAMFDGSCRRVKRSNSAESLQVAITMAGKEPGKLE
jgi:hypothetical protein